MREELLQRQICSRQLLWFCILPPLWQITESLSLPEPCWWWRRAARRWRRAPAGPPESGWPWAPSARACEPGDARCSPTAGEVENHSQSQNNKTQLWSLFLTTTEILTRLSAGLCRIKNQNCCVIFYQLKILYSWWYFLSELMFWHQDRWRVTAATKALNLNYSSQIHYIQPDLSFISL